MPPDPASPPVSLFYSYAHEDESLRNELCGHLKILERRGLLAQWHDRQIQAGEDWHSRISEELQTADLVLLLRLGRRVALVVEVEQLRRHPRRRRPLQLERHDAGLGL